MKLDRVSWIDVARGIGIILVIYGHTLGSHGHRYLIYAFHMPLFFFLSGLVFNFRSNESYFNSLKKDFKRIIVPYFIFAFLSLIFWFLILPPQNQTLNSLLKQIFGIFYGNANNGYLSINTALWFLPCLFLTKQIFWFISKLNKNLILFSLVVFSLIGYLSSFYFSHIKLPLGLETTLTAIVFFGIGYLWNTLPEKTNLIFNKYKLLLIPLFILISFYFANLNFQTYGLQIDLRLNRLNNYFYFYAASISGILGTILLSKLINKNNFLELLGQNSMSLFIWHYFIFIYLNRFFIMTNPSQEILKLRNEYYPLIYTSLSIVIILFLNNFLKMFKSKIKIHPNLS